MKEEALQEKTVSFTWGLSHWTTIMGRVTPQMDQGKKKLQVWATIMEI